MSKTVGIVGAGPSGLAAIKTCLEEGFLPTAFEKTSSVGGMWNYDDDTSPSSPGRLYKSLVLNTSKIMSCYGDFPMSPDIPPFPSHEQYLQYFNDFAEHFELRKHVHFNTEVINVEKAGDYDVTGRWTVHFVQEGKAAVEETFDFIMICSGYVTNPVTPTFPGMDEFTGSVSHSAHYRTNKPFADKNVLVIGGCVSGCDVATDISFEAKQVYMGIRSGFWHFKRNALGGYPYDCCFLTRLGISFLPTWLLQFVYGRYLQVDSNYEALGFKPDRPLFMTDLATNDSFVGQLMKGRVKITPTVQRFSKKGVELIDGTKLEDLDAVIFATGYTVTTPFIDDELVPDNLDTRDLYKYVFPVRLPHATLACIGLNSAITPFLPIAEMQSRWSVQVFKGKITLPSPSKMQQDIKGKLDALNATFGKLRHWINGIDLCDELAKEIGCYPSIKRFLLTDPRLAFKLIFAPVSPTSYRLIGPHRWSGARRAVMNCWEDSLTGLRGKVVKRDNALFRWLLVFGLFLIVIAISVH